MRLKYENKTGVDKQWTTVEECEDETYMAPSDISISVQDVTSERRVAFASSTIFSAMPTCPAVVAPLIKTASVMRPVATAATMRSRAILSHC
jgi:hypothetical protein